EVENAGCGEVFSVVKAARSFLRVAEVLIPMRLVLIVAVGERDDGGHAGIGIPNDALGVHVGVKAERGVLLVQTVIVSARTKRTAGVSIQASNPFTNTMRPVGGVVAVSSSA